MMRRKNSEKSVEELEDKLTAIHDQLQKLMDGMMILKEHNVQTDKELLELKESMGAMNRKGKEKEQVRAKSSNGRAGSMEIQQEGRIRDVHQGATSNGGLKPELNKAVRIQSPRTLLQAYRIARLQGEVFEGQAQSWGLKPIIRTNTGILPTPNHNKLQYNQKNPLPNSTNKMPFEPNLTKNTRIPGRRLSAAEMDERRSKGLCFFCDDKYVPGHKCKGNKQLYLVEVTEDEEVEVEEPEDMTQELLVDSNEFMAISLQAFTGAAGYQTIRVTGYHEKRPLQVLINTRNIMLGVQWSNTLGRILFDFKKRTIEFMYQGKKHVLKGASDQLKAAKAKSLVRKEGADAQFFMMYLVASRGEDTHCQSIQATPRADPLPNLTALIKQYACIFELPTTLPPHMGSYDHRIPLKEASNPVNNKPYIYPGTKKDIIEKLVQEMLDQGTDQKALKHLLEQQVHTDFQVAGISKLLAFDFIIEYKKGSENKAADALSRKPDAELLAISLLTPNDSLYAQIKSSWRNDSILQELIAKLQVQPYKAYTWFNNQLSFSASRPHQSARQDSGQCKSHFSASFFHSSVASSLHLSDPLDSSVASSSLFSRISQRILQLRLDSSYVEMVDRSLEARKAIIQLLKFHLARAQQRMKDTANQHRSERSFEVGDWVYLKLQPYRQISVATIPFNKLAAKYCGPYPIAAKIGLVAYKLLMHVDVLIHPTFHVSQIKKCHEVNHPPILHLSSPYCPQPESILERRLVKRGNKVVCQVRIKWTGLNADSATWEYLQELQTRFPSFNP
ncbi:hypothetical protein A4A49_30277 [Nicotiana attenuata]|uniref:Chromo domain-containing protein n=1 Tax=Nicotiana attenuata TaxID=49451 RepID=A0A1J6IL84_NICAT|nr:hypothetical protein A4A49_30277 [Nicotiana attenuata]